MSKRVFTDEMRRALKHAYDLGTAESPAYNRATLAALVRKGFAERWRGTGPIVRGKRLPFRVKITDLGRRYVETWQVTEFPGERTLPKRFQHWR
jgi:hypothetical protein